MSKKFLLNICGPTSVGKTEVALYWADRLDCPILSTDSRQCYKELAIGSAPPSSEELHRVQHYFIADRSIQHPVTAGEFEKFALQTLDKLFKRQDIVIAVGGSGMYIHALLHGLDALPSNARIKVDLENQLKRDGLALLVSKLEELDPEYTKIVDLNNPRRVIRALEVIMATGKKYSEQLNNSPKERPFEIVNWVLNMDRNQLYDRINLRVHLMIEEGLEAEARSLKFHANLPSLQTVGYREWWPFFNGEYDRERTIELIKQCSRRYAKRQLTYFKRFESALWLDPNDINSQEESLRKAGVL